MKRKTKKIIFIRIFAVLACVSMILPLFSDIIFSQKEPEINEIEQHQYGEEIVDENGMGRTFYGPFENVQIISPNVIKIFDKEISLYGIDTFEKNSQSRKFIVTFFKE